MNILAAPTKDGSSMLFLPIITSTKSARDAEGEEGLVAAASKFRDLEQRAKNYGATDFGYSNLENKKFRVVYKGKTIHFGDSTMQDFTQHHSKDRRTNFRQRMKGVLQKDGSPAYKDKTSPLFWSYHLLW
jgi:hypothetical protein